MKTELIVALDVDTLESAQELVKKLSPVVKLFKIGSQLFTAYGPEAVRAVGKSGAKVFLDLKFHDIPNTVRNAAAAATSPEVFMITVHAAGGVEMMKEAMRGARQRATGLGMEQQPLIVGVTVLTSGAATTDTGELVLQRARQAKEAGIDGIVCSVQETAAVRAGLGSYFVIVNPGIRPAGADAGDQKRVATPAAAKQAGANFIVVGRPILEAADPRKAAEAIIKELT